MHRRAHRICHCACLAAVVIVLLLTELALAQVDEARQAIERKEYFKAVEILSAALADQPSADTYLYLGIAYRRMREYQKAEDIFRQGIGRYPEDTRFHIELADQFLENNDIDAAKSQLRHTLDIDPTNNYASDQLATIDMSQGNIQSALRSWNKSGRPFINDILHNYNLNFNSWVVRSALAFNPAGTLRYSEWKTTEWRLLESDNFSNVGLELEPTRVPDQYNAVVRTTRKTNTPADFVFNAVKGAPVARSYVDIWDIGNSGVNFNGSYWWNANRRRGDGAFKIPLPVGGLTFLEMGSNWRAERWDLRFIQPDLASEANLDFRATTMGIGVQTIPHYRVAVGAGFLYRNRYATGELPQIFTNSLNLGKFMAGVDLRIVDRTTYQNRLHVDAFAARSSIIGNMNFTGGTAELNNRHILSRDTATYFDWALKGGTAFGALPVEEYFVLGLDITPPNLLRGHRAWRGPYGNAPMGTDFVLLNTDIERRLKTLPFFNALNIPYMTVKWEAFFDAAKSWDRANVFQEGELFLDIGAGIKLETPTYSLNFIYGRALREGSNVFFAYYQRRLW